MDKTGLSREIVPTQATPIRISPSTCKKGENVGKIVYKVESKERVNTVVATKFTIGAKIDEKWSTILSQEVNERNREGEREFRFHAE